MDPVFVSPPLPAHVAQLGPVKEAGLRNGCIQKLCADQVQFLLWRFAHIDYIVAEKGSFLAVLLSLVESSGKSANTKKIFLSSSAFQGL